MRTYRLLPRAPYAPLTVEAHDVDEALAIANRLAPGRGWHQASFTLGGTPRANEPSMVSNRDTTAWLKLMAELESGNE